MKAPELQRGETSEGRAAFGSAFENMMTCQESKTHRSQETRGRSRFSTRRWPVLVVAAIPAVAFPALAWAASDPTPTMPGLVDRAGAALAPLVGTWITSE